MSVVVEDEEDHPLQRVHDSLMSIEHFEDREESFPFIQSAVYFMGNITLEHLGIDPRSVENLVFGQCMSIYESPEFDIALFLLPKSFVLPLHDHPHMLVCSKMLSGSVSIRSFSAVREQPKTEEFLGKLELETSKTSKDDAWYLTPEQGNFHEIIALTNCVMLDVILPPYNDEEGRSGTFYSAVSANPSERIWTLKPLPAQIQERVELPRSVPYTGFVPQREISPTTSTESLSVSIKQKQLLE
jgi:hypothetical protein